MKSTKNLLFHTLFTLTLGKSVFLLTGIVHATESGVGDSSKKITKKIKGSKAKSAKPNIVIVITDDQGYGDLGCTGNPIIRTPHTDKLANESVWLTDYHVAPTCSPTRAALMSGHWTNRTGVWHTIMGRSM